VSNKLLIDGRFFIIDDLITEDFIKWSDTQADYFFSDLEVVNELFLHIYMPYLALLKYLKDNNIDNLKLTNATFEMSCLTSDLSANGIIKIINGSSIYKPFLWRIKSFIIINISSLYILLIMFKIGFFLGKKSLSKTENLIIITDQASDTKFSNFSFKKLYSSFDHSNSIYLHLSLVERIRCIFTSFIKSLDSLKQISLEVSKKIGKNSVGIVNQIYAKRLVHTFLYGEALAKVIKMSAPNNLYTGNNLDRFAIVEEKIAKKFNIKLFCVPHGLEYGFKFPKVFTGDVFYTTSRNTSEFLNKLYGVNKFIFSEDIIKTCFIRNYSKSKRIVVFFTESREICVNFEILSSIAPVFEKNNIPFYVKLHPKDNAANYQKLDLKFITNFDEAISNNICIARKSTILLEGIYNNSISIAILTNPKDISFFTKFPSLQTSEIYKSTSMAELINLTLRIFQNKI
jgi:hypothetical protein